MKNLKNCITFRSIIRIYVPSKIGNEAFNNESVVDSTLSFLSTLFGGATTSPALGAWISQDGRLIKEAVNIVFAFASEAKLEEHLETVYGYCEKLKAELKQEAVALEINGSLYLI